MKSHVVVLAFANKTAAVSVQQDTQARFVILVMHIITDRLTILANVCFSSFSGGIMFVNFFVI